ncbi:MAG: hypothetical protein EOM91_06325 [Sphingobacteriia bacterium]|nr:hypothetical protein [Sphingobacteriia bacterium]NCC37855.1 hypothetical protein [Gammaproteobacteria bacterium]
MAKLLLAPLIIFAVLAGWVWVQRLYSRFALRHPELGPFRREGGCSCGSGHCERSPGSEARPARPVRASIEQPNRADH